jgi:eukaryotic-like serine/threonine-protein kinase
MMPGELLADRFEIDHQVAFGGMGTVYRARDRESGEPVAVKVLKACDPHDTDRFRREAWVLSQIHHPAIVRYVAHGLTEEDIPYLVMEWLTGEDLNARLQRAELTMTESVALVRRVAEALSEVHARGVVHRDIKPHNIFLVEGQVEEVKLIDFGIARRRDATHGVTRTGMAIGTPGYMAPEQARGELDLDARVDVFSLGCVLFRCLTGQAPFSGDHVIAVLAKVLLEEAPRLSELLPGVTEPLEALVGRMLSKRRAGRPADGAAVVRQLSELRAQDLEQPSSSMRKGPLSSLTGGEQRLVSVLLIGIKEDAGPSADAATQPLLEQTVLTPSGDGEDVGLRKVLAEFGAGFERLANGTRVAVLMGRGAATDQAAFAARGALAARAVLPALPMALATGRGRLSGRFPMGDVIDCAAALLRNAKLASSNDVRIDELTAGLLGERFKVNVVRGEILLQGEQTLAAGRRTLLGKPTSCVGRERELRTLEDLFDACVAEPAPSAVLVTAEAGVGKSRLAQELIERLQSRGEPVEIWIGRGDPMRAGAPFGLLGQIIRSTARLIDGEPNEVRQKKLLGRVARHVDAAIQQRVAEFLGVMVGTPFPEEESVQLRAARQDAVLMSDQMRRAWVDFVGAECQAHSILLVLEDLHWGDSPTVEYIDTALRLLAEQPLMVLALARPSVSELFSQIWQERRVTYLRLGELSRKACEKLCHEVLGNGAPRETLDQLWERSAGNAFFLEELLRAKVEGRVEGVPGTVLAMVQSRLLALGPDERRLLRAGSVFGQVFWRGAAAALLGAAARPSAIDDGLSTLENGEWIVARPMARFHDEKEYAFRHAIVRDAAYGMLTEEDRVLGHRLAGAWLASVGELDAMVLAEHGDRGGEPDRAAGYYCRAAEQALSGNDLGAVIERAERAIAAGVKGEAFGEVALIRAEAHRWRGENPETEQWARKAMSALPEGSARWYQAAGELAIAASRLVHHDRLASLVEALSASWSEQKASAAEIIAISRAAVQICFAGAYVDAAELQAKAEAAAGRFEGDVMVSAHILYGRAFRALLDGDLSENRALTEATIQAFERAGDMRNSCLQRVSAGYAASEIGAYDEAVALLRAALAEAERLGIPYVGSQCRTNLGLALARTGALGEARSLLEFAIEYFMVHRSQRMEGGARIYLSAILRLAGDLEGAEAEARRAVNVCELVPQFQADALSRLADALRARGNLVEAQAAARRAVELVGSMGLVEEGEAFTRLIYAEVLFESGDRAAAVAAIATAKDRLLARAAKIGDPATRASYLTRVPDHARTLALALAWSGEDAEH